MTHETRGGETVNNCRAEEAEEEERNEWSPDRRPRPLDGNDIRIDSIRNLAAEESAAKYDRVFATVDVM